ncbi:uncharacterized protein TNCV_4840791 [Trichonephila clavipes]|nr:uncharacterized protein TNCV_4840791 [Trichonephila clavipes]
MEIFDGIDDENTFSLDDELHSDTDISSNYLDYSSDVSCSELSSDEDLSSARIFTVVDVLKFGLVKKPSQSMRLTLLKHFIFIQNAFPNLMCIQCLLPNDSWCCF